jgi:soluble lytic murein transglycosylase-like protein
MQSHFQLDPFRTFLARYQSTLVILMGFACAFLLGLLLWNVTSAALPGLGSAQLNDSRSATAGEGAQSKSATGENVEGSASAQAGALSPVFTPEVRQWQPDILRWADQFGLDPNLVAIVMQIESCGNPQAVSRSGAQGLFQVMPFNFGPDEDMLDPETNAQRGVGYLAQMMADMSNDVGLALAAYNGGPTTASRGWAAWPAETQRYYLWGTGIYQDIGNGVTDSPTLEKWLAAGGNSLCRQAAGELGLP